MESQAAERLLAFDEKMTRGLRGWAAGVDEAGRGPLAGPVVAAAVILFRKASFQGLNDSKKVVPARREILFREIACQGLVGIGMVNVEQIDELNIYQATRLAMKKAVLALSRTPNLLLIDGKNMRLDLPLPQKSIVEGDGKSAAIAAASIMAKVYRDAWMNYLDELHPDYFFREHKGYGTTKHLEKLSEHGPSPIHRKTFSPVQEALQNRKLQGQVQKQKRDLSLRSRESREI
jgi:ribonuclease HII